MELLPERLFPAVSLPPGRGSPAFPPPGQARGRCSSFDNSNANNIGLSGLVAWGMFFRQLREAGKAPPPALPESVSPLSMKCAPGFFPM